MKDDVIDRLRHKFENYNQSIDGEIQRIDGVPTIKTKWRWTASSSSLSGEVFVHASTIAWAALQALSEDTTSRALGFSGPLEGDWRAEISYSMRLPGSDNFATIRFYNDAEKES